MKKILLVVCIAGLGVCAWLTIRNRPVKQLEPPSFSGSPSPPSSAEQTAVGVTVTNNVAPVAVTPLAFRLPLRRGEARSAEYLKLVLNGVRNDVTAEQLNALGAEYARLQSELGRLAAAQAQVEVLSPSTIRVSVPELLDGADERRAQWYEFARSVLGEARLRAILDNQPSLFDALTGNFGKCVVDFTVTCYTDKNGTQSLRITRYLHITKPDPDIASRGRGVFRESLESEDATIADLDGGALEVLRPFAANLVPTSSENRREFHP